MRTFLKYLREVRQSDMKKIGKPLNKFNDGKSDMLFDHLFGTKKRIAIPIQAADRHIQGFLDEIQNLNLPITIDDLRKGYINQTVKTERGTQNRQLRIANYFNNIKKDANDSKKAAIDNIMKDWSVVKDKLGNMDLGAGYSIIISRYPLDILRMSDHVDDEGGEIQSCHSPDGGWYHCAIKEAHLGGAVAYAVKTSDLEKIDLQAKEVFKDKDRAVDGIYPIERVRLRRFSHGDRMDILVPEIRTYSMKSSKKVPGFLEAVTAWAKKVQNKELSTINPTADYKNFDLRGGSYQDNKADVIWNNFFGTNVSGSKKSIDQGEGDEVKMDKDEWEARATTFVRNHRLRHVEVSFSASDNGEGQARGTWNADLMLFYKGSEFVKMPPYNFPISASVDRRQNPMKAKQESLLFYLESMHSDTLSVETDGSSSLDDYVRIKIKFGDVDEDGLLHTFENFLDRMREIDDEYETLQEHVSFWFAHNGYMQNQALDVSKQYAFKHFTIDASLFKENPRYKSSRRNVQTSYEITSAPADIGDLSGLNASHARHFNFWGNGFNFREVPEPPIPASTHTRMTFISNSFTKNRLLSNEKFDVNDRLIVRLEFVIDSYYKEKEIQTELNAASEIDRNWEHYIAELKKWWITSKATVMQEEEKLNTARTDYQAQIKQG